MRTAVTIAAAVALLGECAGTKGAAGASHALRGDDLILDLSPAAEILTLWMEPTDAVRARARAIATDLPYQTLRHYYTLIMRCAPSDEEVARAIAVPDSGICGFGLGSAYQERASVDSLVRALVLRGSAIRARVAADVASDGGGRGLASDQDGPALTRQWLWRSHAGGTRLGRRKMAIR